MLKLIKSLTQTLGQEFRQQLHTNFLRIEDFINKQSDKFDNHKTTDLNAHNSKQITDAKFGTVDNGLKTINERYSNLVLSKGTNSLQEVKDSRVDNKGVAHLTLFDRLQSDSLRQDYNKDEVMQTVEDAKNQVLAQEFAFDIPNQSFQYLTNLSPWTNSVMQSFYLDNRTGLFYMTQVYADGYKLTRMKSNGEFLDQMYLPQGGHGTNNSYLWDDVNQKFWIYSFMNRPDGQAALVKFTYRPNETVSYGMYDMEEVNMMHPERPYMTPVIQEKPDGESLILYRIQYPQDEWDARNAANYVEVRRLEDVENDVDNILYSMDIPRTLTAGAQPMQGVEFEDNILYWYSGDSDPNVPNFITIFDMETGEQLYQKQADIGKVGNEYPGNFAEAEGIQLYQDLGTGKKALLVGVTVGEGNYRAHQVHGIFMRDVYDKLTAMATPSSMAETGNRTKTLPVQNFTKLSDITEPGNYYLYTSSLKNISDHPLPAPMRDSGWWLNCSPNNQAGETIQTMTRSTFSRDIMTFQRIVSLNKFSGSNNATNWNHVGMTSIGGPDEDIPSHISDIKDIGIISGKTWYITSARSREIIGLPITGVGMTCEVTNVSAYVFKVQLVRVTTTASIEIFIKYFNVDGSGGYSDWTKMDGKKM